MVWCTPRIKDSVVATNSSTSREAKHAKSLANCQQEKCKNRTLHRETSCHTQEHKTQRTRQCRQQDDSYLVYTVIEHHDEILLHRIEIQENNSTARSNQQNDDHGDYLSALLDGNLLDFAAADCFADFEAAVVVGLDGVGAVVGSDDDVDAQENTSSSGISLQTVSLIQPNPSLTRA